MHGLFLVESPCNRTSSDHTGGMHAMLTEGSVRFSSGNLRLIVWQAIGHRYDGRVVGEF